MRRALMLLAMAWLVTASAANLTADIPRCPCGTRCPCPPLNGCKCPHPPAPLDFPMPSPGS
jgi:hypothetical protein